MLGIYGNCSRDKNTPYLEKFKDAIKGHVFAKAKRQLHSSTPLALRAEEIMGSIHKYVIMFVFVFFAECKQPLLLDINTMFSHLEFPAYVHLNLTIAQYSGFKL